MVWSPASEPDRSSSATGHPSPRAALIERARVVTVNIRDFTLDVRTEMTFKPKYDIPFAVPYCHRSQGEGINFMPEVGSICWICTPSEEGREAFVLSWMMTDENGSYRAGRDLLNPGDIQLKTRDDNFVILRRGGIVQIGSTPVCQRVFLPVRNIIQDLAENYELHTPGGDLTWFVARAEDDGSGHQRCLYTVACHEYADDPIDNPLAILKIGSHGEGNDTIFTLQTRDKGGGSVKTLLEITKAGEVSWTVEKAVSFNFKDDFSLKAGKKASLQSMLDFDIKSMTAIKVAAPNITLASAGGVLSLSSGGGKFEGKSLDLGDAEYPCVHLSPDLILWIAMVTACLNGSGTLHGLSGGLIAPTQHASKKVKS